MNTVRSYGTGRRNLIERLQDLGEIPGAPESRHFASRDRRTVWRSWHFSARWGRRLCVLRALVFCFVSFLFFSVEGSGLDLFWPATPEARFMRVAISEFTLLGVGVVFKFSHLLGVETRATHSTGVWFFDTLSLEPRP